MEFFKERLSQNELDLLDDRLGETIDAVRAEGARWDGGMLSAAAMTLEFEEGPLRFEARASGTPKEGLSCCRVAFTEVDAAAGEDHFPELVGKELSSVDVLEETQTGKDRTEALMYDTTLIFRFVDGSSFALCTYNQLPDRIEAVMDAGEIAEFENEYIMRWQVE